MSFHGVRCVGSVFSRQILNQSVKWNAFSQHSFATKAVKPEVKSKDVAVVKKPKTAFFLFMDEFRPKYVKDHPDEKKSAVAVAKAGGAAWTALDEAAKKVYVEKSLKLKEAFNSTK